MLFRSGRLFKESYRNVTLLFFICYFGGRFHCCGSNLNCSHTSVCCAFTFSHAAKSPLQNNKYVLFLPRVGFSVLFRKSTKNLGLAFLRVSVLEELKRHLCCGGVYVAFLYSLLDQPIPLKNRRPIFI